MISTFRPCSAHYATACARETAKKHALDVASRIEKAHADGILSELYTHEISHGKHNLPIDFYPFMFDNTGLCVAHGIDPNIVGKTMEDIVSLYNLNMNATAWFERFAQGGYVSYSFSLDAESLIVHGKTAYVVPILNRTRLLAVGWVHSTQLPIDPFCSATSDAFCSFKNAQALVGWAQSRLNEADTLPEFEYRSTHLSFKDEFRSKGYQDGPEDDFTVFIYDNEGRLLADGGLPGVRSKNVTDVFEMQGYSKSEGLTFFEKLRNSVATSESGWFRSTVAGQKNKTRDKLVHAVRVEFGGREFYMGSTFDFRLGGSPYGQSNNIDCSPHSNHPCAFQTSLWLAAHTIAHLVTAEGTLEERIQPITHSDIFRPNGFYAFLYDAAEDTCLAHGGNASFVNSTLREVFDSVGMSQLDASQLYHQFRESAIHGSGFCAYDWTTLQDDNIGADHFQKMSFIYLVQIDGRQYIGGVGFDNKQAGFSPFLLKGTDIKGAPIECSPRISDPCSEGVALSLLGQSLSLLILASSKGTATTFSTEVQFKEIESAYEAIENREPPFVINDFSVTVVSFGNSNICRRNDDSGCIVASSSDEFHRGDTWQETLDNHGITKMSGAELHDRLRLQSTKANGSISIDWSGKGQGKSSRKFFSARFQHIDDLYYAFVEYDDEPRYDEAKVETCGEGCSLGFSCDSDGRFCVRATGDGTKRLVNGLGFGFGVLGFLVFVICPSVGWCLSRRRRRVYTSRRASRRAILPFLTPTRLQFRSESYLNSLDGEPLEVVKASETTLMPIGPAIASQNETTREPYIFLCHRGPDTKECIVRPTYHFLVKTLGIDEEMVFFDASVEAGFNKTKTHEIERAASQCTLAVAVLSKNFRDSPYSVGELNIFEHRFKEQDAFVLVPYLWRITDSELHGYSDNIQRLINIKSTESESAPSFLREKLWPSLLRHLKYDPDFFQDPDMFQHVMDKSLCDYVETTRGSPQVDIPAEFEAFYRDNRRVDEMDAELTNQYSGMCLVS